MLVCFRRIVLALAGSSSVVCVVVNEVVRLFTGAMVYCGK